MAAEAQARRETHLTSDGLWIPMDLREFTAQIIIRTPRGTMQHFGTDPLPAYYGMVDADDFGHPGDFRDPQNPSLCPNTVSIKPQGEDAVLFEVVSGIPQFDRGAE